MHLLYITFGSNLKNHTQLYFSVYSFLAAKNDIKGIHIITDMPAFYKALGNKVNIIPVDQQTLTEWKGPHLFFWRIKIKAIQLLCSLYPNEAVLYMDTDTFLYKDMQPLQNAVARGKACMHEKETSLEKAASKTEKKMWQQVKNQVFGGVTIRPAHEMWNAGVVLVPNTKNGADCALALAICDEMCARKVKPRLIEQYALAVALHETYGLEPADGCIAHYWGNKEEWNILIDQFFLSAYFQASSDEEIYRAFHQLDLERIAVKRKVRNTNRRLKQLVQRLFPDRQAWYVKKK